MQRRVTAYTAAGIQCCLPGLGDDLTFPSTWSVQSALNGSLWVRFATEYEKKASGKWWHLLEFEPKAILHSNGTYAFDMEQLGDYGDRVTVLAQRRVFQSPGSCPPEWVAASEPKLICLWCPHLQLHLLSICVGRGGGVAVAALGSSK